MRSDSATVRVLVDGLFFQLANSGISRVWRSVLPHLVAQGLSVTLLDRGDSPEIEGLEYLPFPSHTGKNTAAESELIQAVCNELSFDVFASTYYTTPLTTPSMLIVHDMIPELLGFDLTERDWMEKRLAVAFAREICCVSENTRRDLLRLYPKIDASHVRVAYPGVDVTAFQPRTVTDVREFLKVQKISKPYFLLVGSRDQHKGYKNSALFFKSLRNYGRTDYEIVCVGGEPSIEQDVRDLIPSGVSIRMVVMTDEELGLAYSGALALIYPSLYEGFGLPVAEAMASGCPVVTTARGSLYEVAGDAALIVDGEDVTEMEAVLQTVRDPDWRADAVRRGLKQAERFSWASMAANLATALYDARASRDDGSFRAFTEEWSRLRRLQATVDVLV